MGDLDRIACTGFSKMSDRQLGIWETGSLASITTTTIDQSAGVVMPFWSDNGILFLAGKGDGNIRYYEYESDSLFALSEYKSNDPQRGMCFLPRRALSVSDCEIARAYKVASASIEPIAFIVPRKADGFQSDIFPPAMSLEPALQASEFFAGKTAPPKIVDLQTGMVSSASTPITTPSSQVPPPTKSFSAPAPEPVAAPVASPPVRKPSEPTPTFSPKVETPAEEARPSFTVSPPQPVQSPSGPSQAEAALREENARLTAELREARTQIRNLELQVETMKANAQRAAKALMESQM
jgi:coronin-1B/1C/6